MSSYIDVLNQTTTAATGKSTAKSGKETVMGKEDFLKLLVAQLQNQDPLSPDDPTEFTAQLAQFSSLEQLTSLNDSMDNLVNSNANSDRFATLNTIGKNVAYHSADFTFKGEPVELGYQLDGQATGCNAVSPAERRDVGQDKRRRPFHRQSLYYLGRKTYRRQQSPCWRI